MNANINNQYDAKVINELLKEKIDKMDKPAVKKNANQ
jgi:hypothetical protein